MGSPSGGSSDVLRKKSSIRSIQMGSAVSISRLERFVSRQKIWVLKVADHRIAGRDPDAADAPAPRSSCHQIWP